LAVNPNHSDQDKPLKGIVYLDNHATTPCDLRVVKAMLPFFSEAYGNASSSHAPGRRAAEAVEEAREKVASLLNASVGELVFTSGATESNNLAIIGVAQALSEGRRRRVVTTAVEHKAVLGSCKVLEHRGFEVVVLPVDSTGTVMLEAAEEAIDDSTLLVSMQAANNEVGTIQPVQEVAAFARAYGALVHCDAAQAAGKILVDVDEWDVDLLSVSAHKFYGPKGVGALYVRGGPYALPISPSSIGGGQERNLRAGTLNVPGIVGLGEACSLCEQQLPEESTHIGALRDRLEKAILEAAPAVKRNGNLDNRLPGNSSLTFPGIDAEALIINAPELAISTGSACNSGAPEPSHVLLAIGLDREDASSTIRIGVGRFNTEKEMDETAGSIVESLERLARMRV
jgi:cysteine desulfurase